MTAEGEGLEAEYDNVADIPTEISARVEAIDEELASLLERPTVYDPIEMARAGAFVSLDHDGSLYIERGYVRPEDEPAIVKFHGTLSERSVSLRYFHAMKLSARVSNERLTRMCFFDYDREIALVAEAKDAKTSGRPIIVVAQPGKKRDRNGAH